MSRVIAIFGLVVGAGLIYFATAPGAEIDGQVLSWTRTLGVVEGEPIGLLSHGAELMAFSTRSPNFSSRDSGGLRAWRWVEGSKWESLGEVVPRDHAIATVASAGPHLVALEPGSLDSAFTVWSSPDGGTWSSDEVPTDVTNGLIVTHPEFAAGYEDLLLVGAELSIQVHHLVEERLAAIDGEATDWIIEASGPGERESLVVAESSQGSVAYTAQQLRLTRVESELVAFMGDEERAHPLWVRGSEGWGQTEIPGVSWLESVASTTQGLVVSGFGPTGHNGWVTTDGASWQSLPTTRPSPYHLDEWDRRVIGPALTEEIAILAARGETWDDMGASGALPDGRHWHPGPFAAGPGGVALISYPDAEEMDGTIVFTTDGRSWASDELRDLTHDYHVALLEVTDTHLAIAVMPNEGRFDPSHPPGFEIWMAPLP